MKKIKIYICCHKDCAVPRDSIFTPIHVGAAVADVSLDMLRDDSGDNISNKNAHWNELTAIYWAWKNCDSDYVGFMHYRRHFSFKLQDIFKVDEFTNYYRDFIDDEYFDDLGLHDHFVRPIIEQYDIIMPLKYNVSTCRHKFKNNYDNYVQIPEWFVVDDYNLALEILSQKYPYMMQTASEYNSAQAGYYCNMFIMKRHLFDEYASFLFDIVFEMEKRIDLSDRSKQKARGIAFCAEWLTAIFVTHYIKKNKLNVLELARTFVKNTDSYQPLVPAFKDNNIPVVYYGGNIDFIGVSVASLIACASDGYNYDIIILDCEYNSDSKNAIKRLAVSKANILIRFVDVSYYKFKLKDATSNVFYVFGALFQNYAKVVTLSPYVIILRDISMLFNIDLHGRCCGAVFNYGLLNCEKNGDLICHFGKSIPPSEYLKQYLNMDSLYEYFSFDVSVYDLEIIRLDLEFNRSLATFASREFHFGDSDVLNSLFNGDVYSFNYSWKIDWHFLDSNNCMQLPKATADELVTCAYSPYIVNFTNLEFHVFNEFDSFVKAHGSHIFFEFAKKSPLYEKILVRCTQREVGKIHSVPNNSSQEYIDKIQSPQVTLFERFLSLFFKRKVEERVILKSGAFDKPYYLSTYPDVAKTAVDPICHYVCHGVKEGRNPSPHFCSNRYLQLNNDVNDKKVNPLYHYILHGKREKRKIQ